MPMTLPERIDTESDVRRFFRYLLHIESLNFHPDDPFWDEVNDESGYVLNIPEGPSYTREEARVRQELMDQAWNIVGERIYDIAIDPGLEPAPSPKAWSPKDKKK